MALTDVLSTVGTNAFGLGLPILSPAWTNGILPSIVSDGMALNLSTANWLAPIAGTVRRVDSNSINVTLVRPSGIAVSDSGLLLTLFPHAYLRLARLYAQVFEDGASSPRPGRARGLSARPVPLYFLFTGSGSLTGGHVNPGDDLGQGGELTIYDNEGFPIDVLATASIFQALMVAHNPLQKRAWITAFDVDTQVKNIAELGGMTSIVRLHLSDHAGMPHNGTNLTGMSSVTAGSGLFTLNASDGLGGSDLTGTVAKAAGTGASGTFPDEVRRVTKLGFGTTGRMGDSVIFPAKPAGVILARDFFSLRVVNYKSYLLGTPNPAYDGNKVHKQPAIRTDEPLDLLADGNDVLGAACSALTGAGTESLAVGQAIDGAFTVPESAGTGAHWPEFPPVAGVQADAGAISPGLKNNLNPVAAWFDDGNAATQNIDVVLTLNGLPSGASVRVYNRKFVADAREERGDGAGGIVSAVGNLTLLLHDPFSLRRPGITEGSITVPASATLHVDIAVVKRTGESRVFGNVTAPIETTTTSAPPTGGPSLFGSAVRRAVSNAGVLGLPAPSIGTPVTILDAVRTLTGEGNPRDASRLPTMARRELLVAGLTLATGGAWKSVIAAGRLTPESISAQLRLGAPGSPGGRETQVVGVSTQNGLLAYDLARMALRRTDNIVTRLTELADTKWDEPLTPSPLASGAPPTANSGTMIGAVLQTIAPFCETPELHVLRSLIDPDSTTRPKTWDELVDWVSASLVPSGIPFRQDIINKLNELKGNAKGERLFNETEREIMSAGWGRRDAQWSLKDAIGSARRFIYIESPGFAMTQKEYGTDDVPTFAVDLFDSLSSRLIAMPGLRVIFCAPKFADYPAGYEPLAANEVADRRTRILALPTASNPNPSASRVMAFHPIGFPGRASRIETTVVIVDDIWAMVGSSTFRRRGLSFDGGSDVVFSDMEIDDGVSPAINMFRRKLMADRLGLPPTTFPQMPNANEIQLRDGVEAFHAIRAILIAGGLGRIECLWNGVTEGVPTIPPTSVSNELTNPDGEEFDLVSTLAIAGLSSLDRF